MDEVVSPTVARSRVRPALCETREAAGCTQLEMAKVFRIENGDVTICSNDLRPLLGLWQLTAWPNFVYP
ncbi:hypothetical protein ACIBSW_13330 [Actinoplanes sp. NPDC049668]|uniref:hypothetical protein n=1 Tax=Actinoplanes sp. NPDC049668 TaxID=3363904 RepID=UPI003799BF8B